VARASSKIVQGAVSLVVPGHSAGMSVETPTALIPVRNSDDRLVGIVILIRI